MHESERVIKYSSLIVDILLLNLDQIILLKMSMNQNHIGQFFLVITIYIGTILINIGIMKNLRV